MLDAAGTLLAEVGIENFSANLVCQRAGVTPPAFYRYFDDKYAIIEALTERLFERQGVVLEAWITRYGPQGLDTIAAAVGELLRNMHAIAMSEPGALWIIRALHAVPRLTHIRQFAHNHVASLLAGIYAPYLPHVPFEVIQRRTRMSVEMSFAMDGMLHEGQADPDLLFADAVHVFQAMFRYPDYGRG
jgi:AcrR family transcriptional regulator